MKEMFKSKWMILFIVFVIGMTYINSLGIEAQKNASAGNTDNKVISKITSDNNISENKKIVKFSIQENLDTK